MRRFLLPLILIFAATPVFAQYATSSLPASSVGENYTVGTGGVVINTVVELDSTGIAVVVGSTSDTKVVGIAMSTQSAGSMVTVRWNGAQIPCVVDGTTVIGDLAVKSTTIAGDCHDSGQTVASGLTSAQVNLGVIQSIATVGNTAQIQLSVSGAVGAASAGVISLNGQTGAVLLQTVLAATPFDIINDNTVGHCQDTAGNGTNGIIYSSGSAPGTPICTQELTTDGQALFFQDNAGDNYDATIGKGVLEVGQQGPATIDFGGNEVNDIADATLGNSAATLEQIPTTLPASSAAFNVITTGTNTAATMTVGSGGHINATGTGSITATAMSFAGITGGINTAAHLQIGTSATLDTTGSGTISATSVPSSGISGSIALTQLAVQAPNTVTANATGSSAAPTAVTTLPSGLTIPGPTFSGTLFGTPTTNAVWTFNGIKLPSVTSSCVQTDSSGNFGGASGGCLTSLAGAVLLSPSGSQTITQPGGTSLIPDSLSVVNDTLLNNAGTGDFISRGDSITLPLHGGWTIQLANRLQIPSGNQNVIAIGSASLPDMFSCVTVPGCSAGGAYPYQIGALPVTFPLNVANNTTTVMEFAYNDLSNMGSAPTANQLDYYYRGLFAWSILYATPDAQRLTASSACTTTGTWTAAGGLFPTGSLKTTGAGATLTCTGLNATDAGFIAYKNTSSTSTFTVSVLNAGTTTAVYDYYTGSTTLNQTGYYTTSWGGTSNLAAFGQPGLSGGLTTITYTCVAPDANGCEVVGPYFLSNSMNPQNSPAVLLQYTSRDCGNGSCGVGGHTDANTNLVRAEQYKVFKQLHDDGVNIAIFDPNATPNGYNANIQAQTGQVSDIVVTAGGTGYTTGAVSVSGCTTAPVFAAVPLSGGVLTTGTYYATSGGVCPVNSGLTVSFTGGGSGATATIVYEADGTHPNTLGAVNMAAVAFNSVNSAATPSDKETHTNGVAFAFDGVYAGGVPSPTKGSAAAASLPPGAIGSNTAVSSGSPNTGRFYAGNGVSYLERIADSSSPQIHIWDINSSDQSATVYNQLQTNLFNVVNPAASQATGYYEFTMPGLHSFAFQGWGIGNGSGLSGVVGLYDTTNTKFVWSTCAGDDIYGYVPVTSVCAGTGAAWSILHTGVAAFSSMIAPSPGILPFTGPASAGTGISMAGTASGTDTWVIRSASSALGSISANSLVIGDTTTGVYSWKQTVANSGAGVIAVPSLIVNCWSSTADIIDNACDTGISRSSADIIALGNGNFGDESATVEAAKYVAGTSITDGGLLSAVAVATDSSGKLIPASISSLITSATGGSGTGTVTCLTATCTNLRGTYSVAGGTFTTGTFLTLVWPTTTTAYACTATMNGGTGFLGIGNDVATATGVNISAGVSILGLTVTVNYSCKP